MASKSAVIPALVMLPFIQNQYVHGLAVFGGCSNASSSGLRALHATAKASRAVTRAVMQAPLQGFIRSECMALFPSYPTLGQAPMPFADSAVPGPQGHLGPDRAVEGGEPPCCSPRRRHASPPRCRNVCIRQTRFRGAPVADPARTSGSGPAPGRRPALRGSGLAERLRRNHPRSGANSLLMRRLACLNPRSAVRCLALCTRGVPGMHKRLSLVPDPRLILSSLGEE